MIELLVGRIEDGIKELHTSGDAGRATAFPGYRYRTNDGFIADPLQNDLMMPITTKVVSVYQAITLGHEHPVRGAGYDP